MAIFDFGTRAEIAVAKLFQGIQPNFFLNDFSKKICCKHLLQCKIIWCFSPKQKKTSGAEQSDAPKRLDSDGESVLAPVGDRGRSKSESRTADETVSGAESCTGQSDGSNGMGTAYEYIEVFGRRSCS